MTVVYYADVCPLLNREVFDAYFNALPDFRKEKVSRLKNKSAKNLSLGAWIVLEKCAIEFGINLNASGFSYYENGKPYPADFPNLHISISHSENIAVCAVSDFEIGIDTEYISDCKDDVCRRFFGENECNWIFSAKTGEEKNNRFFRIWTLKESYVKLTGRGMADFKNFEVDASADEPTVISGNGVASVFFCEPYIPGFKTAVCLAGKDKIRFEKINIPEGLSDNKL